jgi:hypothetical protein
MLTNIFISRPTTLPKPFDRAYSRFQSFLESEDLVSRRLGATDYSMEAPLQAIIRIMDECRGLIVLGYPQIEIFQHVRRSDDIRQDPTFLFATPWNQIEAALGYGAKLPVLVVAHPGIRGGIFDHGVTGQYVLGIDLSAKDWHLGRDFQQVYSEWRKKLGVPPARSSTATRTTKSGLRKK